MTQLQTILDPILDELASVDERLNEFSQSSDLSTLDELLQHVFASKGKRARPALTILASGFHQHDKSNVITMAAAVEMLHVATLIHDDTVDEADTRRGRITISSGWGDRLAVLVGDYVFAASATYVCDTGDIKVIRRFSETIMELSRGELQEISLSGDPTGNLAEYLQRIYFKTGSLFATSGESGARLSGADHNEVEALTRYSRKIGTAFQIVDDILDFEADEISLGKPVGSD
ncbi:MAG TPA: polyprenyl synthetase family protein, partial [Dehalococcoidia bacterium]|nr:polyprenyl synthetase family protein [Dehalococcoidia bacterium]